MAVDKFKFVLSGAFRKVLQTGLYELILLKNLFKHSAIQLLETRKETSGAPALRLLLLMQHMPLKLG